MWIECMNKSRDQSNYNILIKLSRSHSELYRNCFVCRAVKFCIQMGQILDFLRSVSVHFGSASQNVLKMIFKSPRFVLFGANLDAKFDILGAEYNLDWSDYSTFMWTLICFVTPRVLLREQGVQVKTHQFNRSIMKLGKIVRFLFLKASSPKR